MAVLRAGTFGAVAGGVIGAAVIAGPAYSTPCCTSESDVNDEFVASSVTPTPNAIFPLLHQQFGLQQGGITQPRARSFQQRQVPGGPGATATANYQELGSGLAAGDGIAQGLTAWGSVSYSDSEDDFAATAFDSRTVAGSIGLDKALGDRAIVGLFFSYSDTDTDSSFNGGGTDSDGWSIGPYASLTLNEILSVDSSFGFSFQDMDNRRTAGGALITGSQDSNTFFFAFNVNAAKWIENWGLSARLGFTYSHTNNDDYVDSTATPVLGTESTFAQVQLTGQVSYYFENALGNFSALPYIKLTLAQDMERTDIVTATAPQPQNDDDEIVLGVGVSMFSDGPFSGGLDFTKTFERTDFDAWSIAANISYRF